MINGGNRNRGGFYDAGQLDAIRDICSASLSRTEVGTKLRYRRQWTEGLLRHSRFMGLGKIRRRKMSLERYREARCSFDYARTEAKQHHDGRDRERITWRIRVRMN